MGKRKKIAPSNKTEDTETAKKLIQEEVSTTETHTEMEKKPKKSKKSVQTITTELPKEKSKKAKPSKQVDQIELAEDDSGQNLKTKTTKKKIKKPKEIDPKPKKVVFVDNTQEGSEISKNRKPYLNDEEAAVKDEDIDKFCDEIDEEDNMQYENWIKMIESTLHPKKGS